MSVISTSFPSSSPDSQCEPVILEQSETAPSPEAARVAIIITCWNYENYVGQAIRSVTSQVEAARCELLVIDDGSSDGSWAVIKREGVRAYRVSNLGQGRACLFGVDRTTAPFILFLDADDELAPGSLAAILSLLDDKVSKLQFPLIRINADGKIIGEASPRLASFRGSREIINCILTNATYITPPTSGNVFRRDVCEHLEHAGYDPAVDGIILLIAPFMGDIVSVSEPLGLYRVHGRNKSGLGAKLDACKLHHDLDRFVDRSAHLRRILEEMPQPKNLVDPKDTFYYLEKAFYLDIAEGRRIRLTQLVKLLQRLWHGPHGLKRRSMFTVFFLIVAIQPVHAAQSLIEYRLNSWRLQWQKGSTKWFKNTVLRYSTTLHNGAQLSRSWGYRLASNGWTYLQRVFQSSRV